MLSLAKMGFRRHEAEAALSSSSSGEVMAHDTLSRLLNPFRSTTSQGGFFENRSASSLSSSSSSSSPSVAARNEEASVLRAIFGDEAFRVVGGERKGLRWEVDTALEFEGGGISPETMMGVLFQEGERWLMHRTYVILRVVCIVRLCLCVISHSLESNFVDDVITTLLLYEIITKYYFVLC